MVNYMCVFVPGSIFSNKINIYVKLTYILFIYYRIYVLKGIIFLLTCKLYYFYTIKNVE